MAWLSMKEKPRPSGVGLPRKGMLAPLAARLAQVGFRDTRVLGQLAKQAHDEIMLVQRHNPRVEAASTQIIDIPAIFFPAHIPTQDNGVITAEYSYSHIG